MNTMLRSIPDAHHAALQALARQRGITQNEVYLQAVAAFVAANDPQVCLGWIQLDRPGDVPNPGDVCPECGYDLSANPPLFVALMADGSVYGPVCNVCATSQ